MAASLITLGVLALPAAAQAAPDGLFVGNYDGTTISQFTIGTGGLLSTNGSVPTGSGSWTLAATPNGKYVYGTNNGSANLSQYAVGSGGTLTPLTPSTVATGSQPEQVAVSPDGKNAYVANSGSGSVSVYDIGAGGTLSLASTVTSGLAIPTGLAISPDGHSVYVADRGGPAIVEFNRSSSGALSPKTPSTVPTVVNGTIDLAITPNGRYVYASGSSSTLIAEYTVGSGGQLAPDASPTAPVGDGNYQVTVSPNGHNLYASSCSANAVYQYSIGSTGELAPLSPPTASTGGSCPELQWMTADGANLYAPDFGSGNTNGDVSQFSVASNGALSLKSPATVPAGPGSGDVIIPPDQGPVARFSSKPAAAGHPTSFNASKSSDSDGKVGTYHWNFGDGHTLTTHKARVSHIYKKSGKHKVTLTVTDDSGCSTTQVFTGQTAYCNGTRAARITHTVATTKALRLKVSPRSTAAGHKTCYAFTVSSGGHGVSRATVKLAGHTTKTASGGHATLCLALRKGTHLARAGKSGYASATAAIHVTAAPGFTG